MANWAEECRRKAEQCERAATTATDLSAQKAYLGMARRWREMAEQAEVREQRLAAKREDL
jgi:hypothetical protein